MDETSLRQVEMKIVPQVLQILYDQADRQGGQVLSPSPPVLSRQTSLTSVTPVAPVTPDAEPPTPPGYQRRLEGGSNKWYFVEIPKTKGVGKKSKK